MTDKTIGSEDTQPRQGSDVEGGQSSPSGPGNSGGQESGNKQGNGSSLDPSAPGETGTTPGSNGK